MTDELAPTKLNKYSNLEGKEVGELAPHKQRMLIDIGIKIERKIGGIEMGVLENGIPYLTQTGLSAIVDVSRTAIQNIAREWERECTDPHIESGTRIGFLKDYLFKDEYDEPKLYLEIRKNKSVHHAYPDVVCMAIIEFLCFRVQTTP